MDSLIETNVFETRVMYLRFPLAHMASWESISGLEA